MYVTKLTRQEGRRAQHTLIREKGLCAVRMQARLWLAALPLLLAASARLTPAQPDVGPARCSCLPHPSPRRARRPPF